VTLFCISPADISCDLLNGKDIENNQLFNWEIGLPQFLSEKLHQKNSSLH
jgi:hypothetical protein